MKEKLTHAQEMIYAHFWSGTGRKSYDIIYARILNSISGAILMTYLRDYQAVNLVKNFPSNCKFLRLIN